MPVYSRFIEGRALYFYCVLPMHMIKTIYVNLQSYKQGKSKQFNNTQNNLFCQRKKLPAWVGFQTHEWSTNCATKPPQHVKGSNLQHKAKAIFNSCAMAQQTLTQYTLEEADVLPTASLSLTTFLWLSHPNMYVILVSFSDPSPFN